MHKSITYKKLPDFSLFIENTFESLSLELNLNKTKTIVTNIYRSPSPPKNTTNSVHMNHFIDHLDNTLVGLSGLGVASYVFTDSNINLLNLNNNNAIEYLNTTHANGYVQVINRATRISGNINRNYCYSLIDHILYNGPNSTVTSGVVTYDISDHFLTFIVSDCPATPSKTRKSITKRNYSEANLNLFKNYLNNHDWHDVTQCNNVDESLEIFLNHFNSGFDLCFPLQTFQFNKNLHPKNKFMTPGLIKSRTTKLTLYNNYLLNRTDENHCAYKTYRNIFNRVLKNSKNSIMNVTFIKQKKILNKHGIF